MSTLRSNPFSPLPIFSLLVSGCWVLMSEYSPVQAQISQKSLFLAQVVVPVYEIPINQQSQPMQVVEFNNQNYQPAQTRQYGQYSPNFQRYFVYVNNNNYQMLQRVKRIEPNAYLRYHNGRNVIQTGVFNSQFNAQKRVKELENYGIGGARIVNSANPNVDVIPSSNPRIMPLDTPIVYNPQPNLNNNPYQSKDSYYVIIPSSTNNLSYLGTEIRQKVSFNINVFRRNQPLGAHIAVGPFSDRSNAEQWNNFLKKSGYGSARVYYGK